MATQRERGRTSSRAVHARGAVTRRVESRSPARTRRNPAGSCRVDDGDILTAGGVTAGIDLALYILEREFGPDVAREVADVMACERQGEVHRS
ncbi:MAG: hypothetical protein V5A55_05860 [Halovenus sp.]